MHHHATDRGIAQNSAQAHRVLRWCVGVRTQDKKVAWMTAVRWEEDLQTAMTGVEMTGVEIMPDVGLNVELAR